MVSCTFILVVFGLITVANSNWQNVKLDECFKSKSRVVVRYSRICIKYGSADACQRTRTKALREVLLGFFQAHYRADITLVEIAVMHRVDITNTLRHLFKVIGKDESSFHENCLDYMRKRMPMVTDYKSLFNENEAIYYNQDLYDIARFLLRGCPAPK